MTTEQRFWSKVAQTGNVCECWIWQGFLSKDGYPNGFRIGDKFLKPIRVAYELTFSVVLGSLEPDHLCGTRDCCNPWHMEAVTQEENKRRANLQRDYSKTKSFNASKTHCKRGHEFSPENTRTTPVGRFCRACQRVRYAERTVQIGR